MHQQVCSHQQNYISGNVVMLEEEIAKLEQLRVEIPSRKLRSMFGDDALGAVNVEMVEVARQIVAASKFTGSDGAVVVFCPDGPSQVKQLEDAGQDAGFVCEKIKVIPSFLNGIDLQTLASK